MALPRKGSRRITVDGVTYRWYLRRTPTYSQGLGWSPCTFAVEHAERRGAVLVVSTGRPHPGNWMGQETRPVVLAEVADGIRTTLTRGWESTVPGSPFCLDLASGPHTEP